MATELLAENARLLEENKQLKRRLKKEAHEHNQMVELRKQNTELLQMLRNAVYTMRDLTRRLDTK